VVLIEHFSAWDVLSKAASAEGDMTYETSAWIRGKILEDVAPPVEGVEG